MAPIHGQERRACSGSWQVEKYCDACNTWWKASHFKTWKHDIRECWPPLLPDVQQQPLEVLQELHGMQFLQPPPPAFRRSSSHQHGDRRETWCSDGKIIEKFCDRCGWWWKDSHFQIWQHDTRQCLERMYPPWLLKQMELQREISTRPEISLRKPRKDIQTTPKAGPASSTPRIRRARQRVQWSDAQQQWVAEFITHAELCIELKHSAVQDQWRQWCFELECRQIAEFAEPVTKAEAFAAWANQRYSWDSCAFWWNQIPKSDIRPRLMDDASRLRILTRLKADPATAQRAFLA